MFIKEKLEKYICIKITLNIKKPYIYRKSWNISKNK